MIKLNEKDFMSDLEITGVNMETGEEKTKTGLNINEFNQELADMLAAGEKKGFSLVKVEGEKGSGP